MHAAPIPFDDAARLDTLKRLEVLDTCPEERFDRITRLAKGLFGTSIALVSLVDEHRQWFKSRIGVDALETPRDISFCGHAILGDDAFIIEDTSEDARFADNPLVTGAPHIRFYAGYPLALGAGHKVGTLCIIDQQPRTFNVTEQSLLKDLAEMATNELIALQLATGDDLTQLPNRRGFEVRAQQALGICRRMRKAATLLFIDLDNFKEINDRHGHSEGDAALIRFAALLRLAFRDSDVLGRLGGDEFAALLIDLDQAGVDEVLARLRGALDDFNKHEGRGYSVEFSVGTVNADLARHHSITMLLHEADLQMYKHKKRNLVRLA